MLPKNTTYTFIQAYTFISFQQKVPPIRLFPPILLLIFREISHLYFYSDSSSIRNSRVGRKIFSKRIRFAACLLESSEYLEKFHIIPSSNMYQIQFRPLIIEVIFTYIQKHYAVMTDGY